MIMQKSRENCSTNYKAVYCIDYAHNTYFLSYRITLALMSSSERKRGKNNNESKSSKKFIAITDESRASHRSFQFFASHEKSKFHSFNSIQSEKKLFKKAR